jgi:hypothetical protein
VELVSDDSDGEETVAKLLAAKRALKAKKKKREYERERQNY